SSPARIPRSPARRRRGPAGREGGRGAGPGPRPRPAVRSHPPALALAALAFPALALAGGLGLGLLRMVRGHLLGGDEPVAVAVVRGEAAGVPVVGRRELLGRQSAVLVGVHLLHPAPAFAAL